MNVNTLIDDISGLECPMNKWLKYTIEAEMSYPIFIKQGREKPIYRLEMQLKFMFLWFFFFLYKQCLYSSVSLGDTVLD